MRAHSLALILIAATASGCRDSYVRDSTQRASVEVVPDYATLKTGVTQQFTATVRDAAGRVVAEAGVTWQSSNPYSLSVDATGLATAGLANGETDVFVIADLPGLRDSAVVHVDPEVFSVWPDTNALMVGMTRKLAPRLVKKTSSKSYTILPVTATAPSWTSSNQSVATVDRGGILTAVAPGQTTIAAQLSDGRIARAEVVVLPSMALRFSSIYTVAGFHFDGPPITAGCGLNAADGGVYCWGEFGFLWGETVLPPPYPHITLPPSYVQAFDRCERQVVFGAGNSAWMDRTRCSDMPVRFLAQSSFSTLETWSCGLSPNSEAICWGSNKDGELGIGVTDTLKHGPTAVTTAERFRSVSNTAPFVDGPVHCGLRGDGAAFCWGGVFGPTVTRMAGDVTWRLLAKKGACGITVDSTAYCWSGNAAPTQAGAGMKFIDIALADVPQRCALTASGQVYCWRRGPAFDPVEPPVLASGDTPLVSLTSDFVGPSPLGRRVCGLSATGDLYCVTQSGSGETATFALQPRDLGGLKFRSVSGNCGIALDGKTYCWNIVGATVVYEVPGQ